MKDRDNGLILVIDDCPLTLQTVNELLTEYGHNALACTNADDAMDLLNCVYVKSCVKGSVRIL